jgi:hypothetical protein
MTGKGKVFNIICGLLWKRMEKRGEMENFAKSFCIKSSTWNSYGGLYKKKGVFSALKTIIYMIK